MLTFINSTDAVMKMKLPKGKSRTITYQKYTKFRNETFVTSLQHELSNKELFFAKMV